MGMGDRKQQFEPQYKPVRDDVIGKLFHSTRRCPHPGIISKYGTGGVANVSYWTCQKCRHKVEYKYHGGLGCGYLG